MKTKTISKYLALGTIALGLVGTTQATPTLQISDGVNPAVTITDNGAGDLSAALGGVSFSGNLGTWALAVAVGTTKPLNGSATSPAMHLNAFGASLSSGTLTIMFSDTGYTTGGGATSSYGLLAGSGGTISYQTYWSPSNALFALSNPLSSFGPAPGYASGSGSAGIKNEGPYSLTQVVTITHREGVSSSADVGLNVPDSGSTLALLGAALAAVGLVSRRRQKNAA